MRSALRFLIAATLLVGFASAALAQSYSAALDGLQEAPPNASPAYGYATLTLDAAKILHVSMEFYDLVAPQTAAHIHGPATPGVNAPVIFPFALGSPTVANFGPLTATQEANLNAGLLYCNVHSQTFPGGEIRGQIIRDVVSVEPKTLSAIKALYR